MATAFTDTFNRGNGPPGAAWTQAVGTWVIESNQLKGPSSGQLRCNTQPQGPNQCAQYTIPAYVSSSKLYGFRLRESNNRTTYVYFTFSQQAASFVLGISAYVAGVQAFNSSVTIPFNQSSPVQLRVASIGDRMWMWANDYLLLADEQTAVQAGGDAVIITGQANSYLDNFYLYDFGDTAGSLDIVPDGALPGRYQITIHNFGPAWTVGTPGSPVFECRAGVIVEQEVTDTDTAVIVWDAPTVATTEQLNDPAYSTYYTFQVDYLGSTSGSPDSGGGLTTAEHTWLEITGEMIQAFIDTNQQPYDWWANIGAIAIHMRGNWTGTDGSAIGDTMGAILDVNNGLAALAYIIRSIWDRLDAATNEGDSTLNDVEVHIRGTNLRDLSGLWDKIDGLTDPETDLTTIVNLLWEIRTVAHSYTLGSIMDAIAALSSPDFTAILNAIDAVRGIGGFDLTNVMSAIAGINIPDPSAQLTTIDNHVLAIPTNPVTSLQPVLDALGTHDDNLDNKADAILDAIALIPTSPITSLQPVLDVIAALSTKVDDKVDLILDAIAALTGAQASIGAPVWPGVANATLGQSVALGPGVTIEAPMDGVIIAITGYRTSEGYWTFDDTRSLRNAGGLAFYDDAGHVESHQNLGFTSAIYSPKGMRRAAGVKIRCAAQIAGTATPWTITES